MLKLLLASNADREYRTEAWPYENRTALEYARHERDRAAERAELPGFGSDWPGGVSQLVEKLDAVIELLQ